METQSISKKLLLEIRKPKFIISFIVLLGIVINMLVLVLVTMPALLERDGIKEALEVKRDELERMVAQPPVTQVTDEEIRELVRRVPTKLDGVQLLYRLNDYAEQSNVTIRDYRQIANQQPVDELELAITSISGTGGAAGTRADSAAKTFVADAMDVTIVGHLPNLLRFVDRVKETEQILDTMRWHIAQGDVDLLHAYSSLIVDGEMLYTMSLTIHAYSMPDYASLFDLNGPQSGTSLEEALRSFMQRYPESGQFDSVRPNR